VIGTLAGFLRGPVDAVLRSIMELVWSFPVVLLGVALGTALALGGIGPVKGNSLFIPAFIIGFIYIPYFGKPIRAEVLRLREQDFVDAARVQGMSPWRLMFSEIAPNLTSTLIVFAPLLLAQAIILEAYLSFLGAGVQPPNPSWGTLISEGIPQITTAAHLTLAPGLMLVLAVLGANVFGDGVRDALDPRAQVRIEH
jgi:peptide/nickel transport system permease protein